MKPADKWFPMFIGDFVAGVLDLSRAEIGSYVLLLMHQWTTCKPLPDDEQTLANIARCSLDEWRACAPRILAKFRRVEGGYLQMRLAGERHRADRIVAHRQRAGFAGALARWEQSGAAQLDLPGVDLGDDPIRVNPDADAAGMHNDPAQSDSGHGKNGKTMRLPCVCQWQTDGPSHGPFRGGAFSYDQHARPSSRACACARASPVAAIDVPLERPDVGPIARALEREGAAVNPSDPMLARLVGAGIPLEEFVDVAREGRRRHDAGHPISSLFAWTCATIGMRHRAAQALELAARDPPDWRASRPGIDARARALGVLSWDGYQAALMRRGETPYFARWFAALEQADAAARAPAASPAAAGGFAVDEVVPAGASP